MQLNDQRYGSMEEMLRQLVAKSVAVTAESQQVMALVHCDMARHQALKLGAPPV